MALSIKEKTAHGLTPGSYSTATPLLNNSNNDNSVIYRRQCIIALMLVGPSKCVKQIIQIELNRVKNPNWLEANQLAIYKHGRGFELGTTVNKICSQ